MTEELDVLYQVVYGSKLYGTSTPTSDTDLKSVYLPAIDDMLLGKRLVAHKTRADTDGNKIADDKKMPDNGVENEFIPFQTFVRDFVQGQTYAVELAFAIANDGPSAPSAMGVREHMIVLEMIGKFRNSSVYSMVSFAQKQTLDYVHRGERLNEATAVLRVLEDLAADVGTKVVLRLDTGWSETETYLDEVVRRTGLKTSTSTNNHRTMRTLELNGRSYLETTTLEHIIGLLKKRVAEYGVRTNEAAKTDVDFKSLSHAVRVYEQSIELLDTGCITLPRPNFEELLAIKQGRADLEEVKAKLKVLDAEVLQKQQSTLIRQKTPELVAEAEQWLLSVLRELYGLS